MRIVLIGCGAAKLPTRAEAKDLYIGSLFTLRRKYAEAVGDHWAILSAKHGLVFPLDELDPYDLTLDQLSAPERRKWAYRVCHHFHVEFPTVKATVPDPMVAGELERTVVELHAGAPYRELVFPILEFLGYEVQVPLVNKGIGEQKAFYVRRLREVTP